MSENLTEESLQADLEEVHAAAAKAAKIGSSEMTEKVSKLVRQAEAAPEGSPEREAFMERAMTLAQAYTIDMDLARANTAKKEKVQEPEEVQYQTGSRTGASNRVSNVSPYLCELLMAIGRVYNMRAMISRASQYVWLTGFPTDHKMVERLYALTSVQMVQQANAALRRGENKTVERVPVMRREEIPESERAWGEEINPDEWWDEKRYAGDESEVGLEEEYFARKKWASYTLQAPPTHRNVPVLDEDGEQVYEEREVSRVDGRVWRKSFYDGFIAKTERRMRESRAKALKEAGIVEDASDERGLVLLDKKEQIDDHFQKVVLAAHGNPKGSWKGSSSNSGTDWSGHRRGEEAAASAVHGDEMDLRSGS